MVKKLTLSLNRDVIENAKRYARRNKTSLSALVENYFRFIARKETPHEDTLSPIVKELSGTIKLPDDFNLREEYTTYLTKKYR